MNKDLFITGIGTGIGKTIVSALLTEQLKADYWKPVQAGDLDQSDSLTVKKLISNRQSIIHPETFRFKMAASPHKAAQFEGIKVQREDFSKPDTPNRLIIEGAGGLMVPLSDSFLMIDLIRELQCEVIMVIRNYLGCINHSLLSLEALVHRGIHIRQIVFNGEMDPHTEEILRVHFPAYIQAVKLPEFKILNKQTLLACAGTIPIL